MPRVLVAYKKSRLETAREFDAQAIEKLLRDNDPSVSSWQASHDRHQSSLEHVLATLDKHAVDFQTAHRADVETVEGFDLVVAVGGDGTILDLSHCIDDTPILGVNSDPHRSFGYFCASHSADFEADLARVFDESWTPFVLNRFYIEHNGVRTGYPILNDVLVAHANPAAVTKTLMRVSDSPPEAQKSSGVWISTAAGSTAAIRSAGGYVMPLDSTNIQYLVREPCPPSLGVYKHLKGIRGVDETFEITSRMREGRVYLDGPHLSIPFEIGDVVSIDGDAPGLKIYGVESKARD